MIKLVKLFVTNEMIYANYFEEYSLTGKFHSPFRYDPKPSLSFKNIGTYHNPYVIWNDFGLYEFRNDGIGFVSEMFRISSQEAARKIWRELVLEEGVTLKRPDVKVPLNLPYEFITEDLGTAERSYWYDLFFHDRLIDKMNIKKLSKMMRGNKIIWKWAEDNPTFYYGECNKVYRPLDKDKFRGQDNGNLLEGYDILPSSGDILFVNSSYKDTGCMLKLGYDGLNPTSENSFNTLLKKRRELEFRFKRIILFFDNDFPGIRSANNLSKETGWEYFFLPKDYGKDPSDCVKKFDNYYHLKNYIHGTINRNSTLTYQKRFESKDFH